MFSMNSANSMTMIFIITAKGLDPVTSVSARQDLQIEPNSCFIGLSYSLNSLNSMKVLLHLEKTPLILFHVISISSENMRCAQSSTKRTDEYFS